MIEKIGKKMGDSSVLLFVPFTEQNPYRELIEAIQRTGIRYINGTAETRNPEMDGKWNAAMFFFTANAISNEQLQVVEHNSFSKIPYKPFFSNHLNSRIPPIINRMIMSQ